MKSPGLSNLKFLSISTDEIEILEEIFINPIHSNLEKLYLGFGNDSVLVSVKFLSNCTNLVNLTSLDLGGLVVFDSSLLSEILKELKHNPTFSKLKHIELPVHAKDDDDSDWDGEPWTPRH